MTTAPDLLFGLTRDELVLAAHRPRKPPLSSAERQAIEKRMQGQPLNGVQRLGQELKEMTHEEADRELALWNPRRAPEDVQ